MRFSLRVTVPILFLLLAVAISVFTLSHNTRMAERNVEREALDALTQDMTRFQGTLEYLLRQGNMERAQEEIAALGSDPYLRAAFLADEEGRILASTRPSVVGRSADEALSPADPSEPARRSKGILSVQENRIGRVDLSADGGVVTGFYPVLLGAKPGELRPTRVGLFFMQRDLGRLKAQARRAVEYQVFEFSIFLAGLAGVLWLFFHAVLTRRMSRLVSAAGRFAKGDLDARTGVGGRDEIGDVGRAFDRMAQQMAADRVRIEESEARLSGIFDIAAEAIISVDETQRILLFNKGAEQIFGYDASNAVGRPLDLLLPPRFAESHRGHIGDFAAGPETSRRMSLRPKVFGRRKDGTEFPAEASISKLTINGRIIFTAIVRDITERERAQETIRRLAYFDSLTRLPNRAQLYESLQRMILEGRVVALLLIDLDRFKEVNDTLGHQRGDILLQQVGSRLQSALRPSDIVARLGGDEFAVVLPLAGSKDAARVAGKILKALDPPFVIDGLPIIVEASIGLALYPDHDADADGLIRRADVAMYSAKRTGDNYAVYAPELDHHSPHRLALMGELRYAIENNELLLHYQPKVDIKRRCIVGTEALVRWRHPYRGMIPPDQFIHPAEQTGLIHPLTRWVFNAAQRQCLTWRRAGKVFTVAINLSTRNLHDPQLPDRLARLLSETGVPPDAFELEITESAIMADPARALEAITRLKAIGIHFAIDDFGTGYSSLAYIKKLPVDAIKIDRSFILNMTKNENDAVIVRSTVELGHNLGLDVVAEGVENQETYDRLADLGCDIAQGYYICRPVRADELTRWVGESPWGLRV